MKYLFSLLLTLLCKIVLSQVASSHLYGTWINCKVTYNDNQPLPDEHPLKYVDLKYKFSRSGQLNTSTAYFELGTSSSFEVNDGYLYTRNPEGGIMNSYRIASLKDTLILTQQGPGGYDDPEALKFYFVPETVYQNSIVLQPNDILAVQSQDTIYKENRKTFASYKGESFQRYVYAGIKDRIKMDGRVAQLAATFIVSKAGIADSLKILEGVDDEFNKRFIRVFNQSKKDWTPAMLNGKPVAVQMIVELRYSTSATTIPAYFAAQKANEAFRHKDYELAIYFYDKALESIPTDKENLYRRGMCKLQLGNKTAACEDWNAAKALSMGSNIAIDAMIEKYRK